MPRRATTATPAPPPPDTTNEPLAARLNAELTRLQARLTRIEAHQQNANREVSQDWQDRANEIQNDEVVEALLPMTRREIGRIKRALARLESGEPIVCEDCGKPIPEKRLAIVPETHLCASCAS